MKWKRFIVSVGLGMTFIGAHATKSHAGSVQPSDDGPQLAGSPAPSQQDEVHALIAKLADEDYTVRASAEVDLRKMGTAILPLLEKSLREGLCPEAKARVEAMVRSIWQQIGKPMATPEWLTHRPRFSRDMTGRAGKHAVFIHEDCDGINLSITSENDGKTVERHAAGIDPAHLREADPSAFESYWQFRGRADSASNAPSGPVIAQQHSTRAGATQTPIPNPDEVMRRELHNPDLTPEQRSAEEKIIGDAAHDRATDGSTNAL